MNGKADKRPDHQSESKAIEQTQVACGWRFEKADDHRDQEAYADRQAEAGVSV